MSKSKWWNEKQPWLLMVNNIRLKVNFLSNGIIPPWSIRNSAAKSTICIYVWWFFHGATHIFLALGFLTTGSYQVTIWYPPCFECPIRLVHCRYHTNYPRVLVNSESLDSGSVSIRGYLGQNMQIQHATNTTWILIMLISWLIANKIIV